MSAEPQMSFVHDPRHDIDRQINARLVEIWNEESPQWTSKMKDEFKEVATAARVTHGTLNVSSHKIHRRTHGRIASLQEYIVLAAIFGTPALRRLNWVKDLEKKQKQLKFYDGVLTAEVKRQLVADSIRRRRNTEPTINNDASGEGNKEEDPSKDAVTDDRQTLANIPTQPAVAESSDAQTKKTEGETTTDRDKTAEPAVDAADMQFVSQTGLDTVASDEHPVFKTEEQESKSQINTVLPAVHAEASAEDGGTTRETERRGDHWALFARPPRSRERIQALEDQIKTQNGKIAELQQAISDKSEQVEQKIEVLAQYVATYMADNADERP